MLAINTIESIMDQNVVHLHNIMPFRPCVGVLICHRACHRRKREIREGSCLPRTAATDARGGAQTAWHKSSTDTPTSASAPTGYDRRHEGPLAQWVVDGYLTTPHLHDLYHVWLPTGENHLITNSPTGDTATQCTQEDTQTHQHIWCSQTLTGS